MYLRCRDQCLSIYRVLMALLHKSVEDSLHESSMIAGRLDQLGPYEVQDEELVGLQ